MPFELFHSRFPEIAETETRTITILDNASPSGLPAGDYGFMEMFCNEPGCDCRRVFFNVFSERSRKLEATISYGWESAEFYRKWFKYGTEEDIASLIGPELNWGSHQGKHADALLRLFKDSMLPQKDYIQRVIGHYRLFRTTVDQPWKPPKPLLRNLLLRRRRPGG